MIPEVQPQSKPVTAEAPPYQPPTEDVPTISFTADQKRQLAQNLLSQKDEFQKVLTRQRLDNVSFKDDPEAAQAAGKEKTSGLDIVRLQQLIKLLDAYQDDRENEDLLERIAIASTSVLEPDTLTRESGASLDAAPPAPIAEPAPLSDLEEPDQEEVAMKGMLESEPEELLVAEHALGLLESGTLPGLQAYYQKTGGRVMGLETTQKLAGLVTNLEQYRSKPGDMRLVAEIAESVKELLPQEYAKAVSGTPGRRQRVRQNKPVLAASSAGYAYPEPSLDAPASVGDIDEDIQDLVNQEGGQRDYDEPVAAGPQDPHDQHDLDAAMAMPSKGVAWDKLTWQAPETKANPEKQALLQNALKVIDQTVRDPEKDWLVGYTVNQATRGFESSTNDLRAKYRAYDFIPAIKTMLDNFKTLPQNQRFSHQEMNLLNQHFHRRAQEERASEKSE